MRLAFFVSPHGFGHAARSAAVMEAIGRRIPGVQFEIFTTVPAWFFEMSLSCRWRRHPVENDIGLVQRSALEEDVEETLGRLEQWVPFAGEEVKCLADSVGRLQCQAVVCDISPLGIEVAKKADVPSILVENFTWDWIYRPYTKECPGLEAIVDYFEGIFAGADLRIQTTPHCWRQESAHEVAPVSRGPRRTADDVRRDLGVGEQDRVVLVSMGGIPWDFTGLDRVAAAKGVTVVLPGGSTVERRVGAIIALPHRSRFYHPDLMHAADGVVGKVGYSTIAEAWAAGIGMGWIRRPTFPESDVLARWVKNEIGGVEITARALNDGTCRHRVGGRGGIRNRDRD